VRRRLNGARRGDSVPGTGQAKRGNQARQKVSSLFSGVGGAALHASGT
jgi:hypothetical protein